MTLFPHQHPGLKVLQYTIMSRDQK
jgi:hypothetical protein